MSKPKVPFPIDKQQWHPSLIPGPIALISTVNENGNPNIAPKSWIQMVSFEPSILMFSGSESGHTEQNILATGCFAVNLVDGALAQRAFDCVRWQGRERIEQGGFTLAAATTIKAPLVETCKAHLECTLHETKNVGSGFVVFGEIVSASIDSKIVERRERERYPALDLALFLEDGLYATVDRARPSTPESDFSHTTRYAYFLTHAKPELFNEQLIRAHVAHLKVLEREGKLDLCGPFPDHAGGMVILRGVDAEQAVALAEADPFVSSGAESYEVRRLEISCRENNHLGMG